MNGLLALAIVAVIAFVVWWIGRGAGSRQAEIRLRQICMGDQDQVEQLIAAEMRRAPGITRAEAATCAVQRFERDNR